VCAEAQCNPFRTRPLPVAPPGRRVLTQAVLVWMFLRQQMRLVWVCVVRIAIHETHLPKKLTDSRCASHRWCVNGWVRSRLSSQGQRKDGRAASRAIGSHKAAGSSLCISLVGKATAPTTGGQARAVGVCGPGRVGTASLLGTYGDFHRGSPGCASPVDPLARKVSPVACADSYS
jgi:hypothetical protein